MAFSTMSDMSLSNITLNLGSFTLSTYDYELCQYCNTKLRHDKPNSLCSPCKTLQKKGIILFDKYQNKYVLKKDYIEPKEEAIRPPGWPFVNEYYTSDTTFDVTTSPSCITYSSLDRIISSN